MPKVSFIVAVYNSMPYLTQCLDSLLGQTVKDIEVICVNDCSPDNSAEIIQNYIQKDSRVKLINHTTNKRQGGAWNSGVKAATGEYLCFVDADDWLESDYCDIIDNEKEDADILVARNYFQGNSKVENIINSLFQELNYDFQLYRLLYGCFFITNFYKRNLFSDFKFMENNMYHDFMTHKLFFSAEKICIFEKPGYHYRIDNISTQRSINNPSFWGRLDVAKMELESYKCIVKAQPYMEAVLFHFYQIFYVNTLIKAFWGYTTLNWAKIAEIEETTKEVVPDIKKNKYYNKRFEGVSCLMRLPVLLFENSPKCLVNFTHSIYWFVRRYLK